MTEQENASPRSGQRSQRGSPISVPRSRGSSANARNISSPRCRMRAGSNQSPSGRKRNSLNRDRGEPRGSSPPTPPDIRVRIRRFAGLSGKSCSVAAVVWMTAIVAPASTPLISASRGFTLSRRSEAGYPEFSRLADARSLHLLVTSSVQAFSETRSACRVGGGAH